MQTTYVYRHTHARMVAHTSRLEWWFPIWTCEPGWSHLFLGDCIL